MCGIVGYLRKGKGEGPVGEILYGMLGALCRRGPDSTGVALYGGARKHGAVLRVKLAETPAPKTQVAAITKRLRPLARVTSATLAGELLRLELANGADPRAVERVIEEAVPGTEVFSFGKRLEVVKRVGFADQLERLYGIRAFQGTHGIGHTRLATESRVDISHSQPFWAHGMPDLAVVHNGHITNYHRLRALYEMRGYRFYTENDSEVIGVYLADEMRKGKSFEEALRASLDDLDGTYSYLAATADQLGVAKDFFSAKPLMMAEHDDFVVLATEEVALYGAFGRDLGAWELPAKEVRVWSR